MNTTQINEEIAKLEKDLLEVSDPDKAIIQEEISRLKDSQITHVDQVAPLPENTGLVEPVKPVSREELDSMTSIEPVNAINKKELNSMSDLGKEESAATYKPDPSLETMSSEEQELMAEARQETGEGTRQKYPSALKIKIDNQKIEKIIDGEKLEGKPLQRFINVTKEGEEWITADLGSKLSGVILKVRRIIKEKYDESNPTKQRFQSFEYTQGDVIRIFTGQIKTPTIIFQGTEDECVQEFATGELNIVGKPKVNYDKFALIYMLIKDGATTETKLIKFETKISIKDHPIWNYLFSFGDDDSFLAWQTDITLKWIEVTSIVKFWGPVMEKGLRVDLKESLKALKELNQIFDVMDGKSKVSQDSKVVLANDEEPPPMIDSPSGENYSQPEEEIAIPF